MLDGRLETSLAGNKNKTGCSGRDLIYNQLACARTEDSDTLSPDVSTATEIRTHFSDSGKVFDKNCVLNSTNNAEQFQHVLTADTETVHKSVFRFVPLEPLRLYTGDPVYYQTIPDIISTHLMIKNSGFPNFLKCRIPVKSKLNVDRWRSHLADYWDQQLLDLLEYGFPIDFDRNCPLVSTFVNHASTLQNDTHVSNYLQEELQHEAIIGPFMEPPFPIHISPLMTRDKHKDLAWFNVFLSQYNGVTYYDQKFSRIPVHLDACLTGLGGHYGTMVYSLPIPLGFMKYTIVHLEILNIVVAAKIWANHWANQKIQIFCDNMAVVEVLTTGKTRDATLATCARNLWLIAALYNINFIFSHIPGADNSIADLLSRWDNSPHHNNKLDKLIQNPIWLNTHINLTLLNYVI